MGYSKVGYPEIVTEQILLQPVTHRKKPASSLAEAVSSQQQYQQGMSRTTEGKGPLQPLTPTVPKRTEVVLVHADLEEGMTAANPELLPKLTGETQEVLPRQRANRSDIAVVPSVPEIRAETQINGVGERRSRHRRSRVMPTDTPKLPKEEGKGVKSPHNPLSRLREDNSCLLDEVMHQQDKREQLEAEKDELEQLLEQTACQHAEALAEAARSKKSITATNAFTNGRIACNERV